MPGFAYSMKHILTRICLRAPSHAAPAYARRSGLLQRSPDPLLPRGARGKPPRRHRPRPPPAHPCRSRQCATGAPRARGLQHGLERLQQALHPNADSPGCLQSPRAQSAAGRPPPCAEPPPQADPGERWHPSPGGHLATARMRSRSSICP